MFLSSMRRGVHSADRGVQEAEATAGEVWRRTTEASTPLLPKAVVDELEGRNIALHEVHPRLPGVRPDI